MTSMNKAFVFKSDCSIFIDNLLLYAHVVCIKQTLNDVDVYVCPSCSSWHSTFLKQIDDFK